VGFCGKNTRIQWCVCSVCRWSRTLIQLPLRQQYQPLNLLPNWWPVAIHYEWSDELCRWWDTGIFLSANYPPVRYLLWIWVRAFQTVPRGQSPGGTCIKLGFFYN
jgi:hypothetical protein